MRFRPLGGIHLKRITQSSLLSILIFPNKMIMCAARLHSIILASFPIGLFRLNLATLFSFPYLHPDLLGKGAGLILPENKIFEDPSGSTL